MVTLYREHPGGSPAFDTAVSRALLERVATKEIEESFRLYRPQRVVAFGTPDANEPGFPDAVAAARERSFDAVIRLAGGRAAVFHEGTIAFAHAIADAEPKERIRARFAEMADMMRAALASLGIDARVGEVPGEYCPGDHSVNARGAVKIVGVGQRLIPGAVHVGGVVVAEGASLVRDVLVPVYDHLGLRWDPATAGSAADECGATWTEVERAILDELKVRHDVAEAALDEASLALAARLAPRYAVQDPAPGVP